MLRLCFSITFIALTTLAGYTQTGWFEDFEGESSDFGFDMQTFGNLPQTGDIDVLSGERGFLGSKSAYFSELWDGASRELGIQEGLVSIWFYDGAYYGTEANAIRLRTADDGDVAGWPNDFVTVELRGLSTFLSDNPIHHYYVARPCPDCGAMGLFWGKSLTSGASVQRVTQAWNHVTFLLDDGKTYTSVNGHPTTCVVDSELTDLELLCHSGWYMTRGGEAEIMLWDDICVMPKIHSTSFQEGVPEWLTLSGEGGVVQSASPSLDFRFLPDANNVIAIDAPDTKLTAPWNVERGAIEVWFWDTNTSAPGYKTEVKVSNADNADEWIEFLHYSVVMNNVADGYYIKTHDSSRGNSFKVPRTRGWHKLVFRKVNGELRLAIDGTMGDGETFVWSDPPDNLLFEITGGDSNYMMGSGLWFGRIMTTGEESSSGIEWSVY